MKRKGIGVMCSILCTSILLGGTTINYARDFFDVEGTLTKILHLTQINGKIKKEM